MYANSQLMNRHSIYSNCLLGKVEQVLMVGKEQNLRMLGKARHNL